MRGPPSRVERALLVLTPAAAMAAVAVGLRLGGRGPVRAAIVRGAPPAAAATGLAWSVLVLDEERGAREPAAGVPLEVLARGRDGIMGTWRGATNEDGIAEALLPLPGAAPGPWLEVRSGGTVLAQGEASAPPTATRSPQAGWLRFARRDGPIALDVALLGGRAAPGFPAELWARATDATTHEPLAGVSVALDASEGAESLGVGAATPAGRTDGSGWARVVVTPIGLAVTVTLRARAAGRSGEWIGGLTMSPGAPRIEAAERVAPGAPVHLAVTMPTARSAAYLEIDDAVGRAWAATLALTRGADGTAAGALDAPALPPGLYWAIAAADPGSAATLESGSAARPFFVAASDADALGEACGSPRDPRDDPDAVSACLALAHLAPVPRWTALDGFARQRVLDGEARARGLAVALGALAIAIVLEGLLLVRASVGGRARAVRTVAVAVLVGLLGFALLAAFLVRV